MEQNRSISRTVRKIINLRYVHESMERSTDNSTQESSEYLIVAGGAQVEGMVIQYGGGADMVEVGGGECFN